MTNKIILFFLIGFMVTSDITAQNLEEEIGFQYVKGNYLFDSGRFDEAIQIYNDIVKEDPTFKDVLVYRARAKYALGAYKGAKKDGLAFIEYNGLSEDVCLVLGKSELGLGNPLIAISYLDYTVLKNNQNADGLLFRGNAYFELEDDISACTDWHKAMLLGSDLADQQTSRYCQRVPVKIDEYKKEEPEVVDNGDNILDEGEILSSGTRLEDPEMNPSQDTVMMSDETLPPDDTMVNNDEDSTMEGDSETVFTIPEPEPEPIDDTEVTLEIDADLDIKIYKGVGNREVRVIPDIIILADNSGQVVVDICVDKSGNVTRATLNRDESTVGSAGLISLALRKSREFKFDRSMKMEQCGKLAFIIK
jgi:tetratricopeptide (TPR) repeat protein